MTGQVRRKRFKTLKKKMGTSGTETASQIRGVTVEIEKMEKNINTLVEAGSELDEFGKVIMPQIKEFKEFTKENENFVKTLEKRNLNKLSFEELVEVGDFIDIINEKNQAINATFQNYLGDANE